MPADRSLGNPNPGFGLPQVGLGKWVRGGEVAFPPHSLTARVRLTNFLKLPTYMQLSVADPDLTFGALAHSETLGSPRILDFQTRRIRGE